MTGVTDPGQLREPDVYQGGLNPSGAGPEYALRQIYKRIGHRGRIPIGILQALADAGCVTPQAFATSLGSTREAAETALRGLPEVTNNWSPREAVRRLAIGFLLSVWEELYGRDKPLRETRNKNLHSAEPTVIVDDEVTNELITV